KSFQKEDEFEPKPLREFNTVIAANDFYGTTWSKAGMKWINPDIIWFFRYDGDEDFVTVIKDSQKEFNGFYDFSYLERKDKYGAFISGNNARVDVTGPSRVNDDGEEIKRPKMLLVKDSFAHSIVPFLAYHYDLVIIDLRYFRDSVARIVYNEKIDRILFLHNMQNFSEDDTFGMLLYGVESVLADYEDYLEEVRMAAFPIRGIFINGNPINDYTIVYPAEENPRREQVHIDAAESLRDEILRRAGVEIAIARIDEIDELEKVILFTREGLPTDNNLMKIETSGNNLIFRCNIGTDPTGHAVSRFIARYLRNATGSFNFGANFMLTDIGDDVIVIMPGAGSD
ncbi:MAG: DHHW family protein, partial [Oscillospiraceae bacterium]|nr:DHHW family protein [Oscillospiraceae bacterium]